MNSCTSQAMENMDKLSRTITSYGEYINDEIAVVLSFAQYHREGVNPACIYSSVLIPEKDKALASIMAIKTYAVKINACLDLMEVEYGNAKNSL